MSGKFDDEISYATHKKHSAKFKLVFIGDQAVGKSSIISRFIKNEFDTTHNPTVGIDFVSKNVQLGDKSIRLQLWDTAGQERFRSLIPGYLRDSHGIFVVYDITNEESYSNLHVWLDYIKQYRGQDVLIFLVGNKIDTNDDRVVSFDDVKERFGKSGAMCMEVSAKTGQNLQALFTGACQELMKSIADNHSGENTHSLLNVTRKRREERVESVTGQKERPTKKEQPIKSTGKVAAKGQAEPRGTKLQSQPKKSDGTVVREKNCC